MYMHFYSATMAPLQPHGNIKEDNFACTINKMVIGASLLIREVLTLTKMCKQI